MNMNFNPAAILAAILYHIDDQVQGKIKMDDSGEEKDIEMPVVDIKKEGDTLMCIFPAELALYFANTKYHMHYSTVQNPKTNQLMSVIGFEKAAKTPVLVAANGHAINTSTQFKKLFESVFSGLKEARKQ